MVDKLFFHGEPMALRCFFKNLPMFCLILIGPLFYQGFYTKDRLDFPLAYGHRSVRPTRLGPSGLVFCFYPLQKTILIGGSIGVSITRYYLISNQVLGFFFFFFSYLKFGFFFFFSGLNLKQFCE